MLFDKQLRRKLSQLSRKQAVDQAGDADAEQPEPAPPPEPSAPPAPPTPRRVGLDDISKQRLRAKLHRPGPAEKTAGRPSPAPRSEAAPAPAGPAPPEGPPQPLDELVKGESVETEAGPLFVVEQPAAEACAWGDEAAAKFEAARSRLIAGEPGKMAVVDPERVLFLDLETAGLSNAPVFLVGLLWWRGGQLRVEQLLARHYAEEAALLCLTAERLARSDLLITYNGATFDVPFLKDRAIYHRRPELPELPEPMHVDLLRQARDRFKGKLPDCKLQTLETHLCGRHRTDDVPSAQIPDRYHEFVASEDGRLLLPILQHNAIDLITLAELVGELM